MVVYYKKKVYLTTYYKKLLQQNKVVIFFHISDLQFLNKFRDEIGALEMKAHLFKNNMAKKVFNSLGFDSIFYSNTIAIYADLAHLDSLYNVIKNNGKNIAVIALKVENYILLSDTLLELSNNKSSNRDVLLKTLGGLQNVYSNFFEFFFKINYMNLIKLCQR